MRQSLLTVAFWCLVARGLPPLAVTWSLAVVLFPFLFGDLVTLPSDVSLTEAMHRSELVCTFNMEEERNRNAPTDRTKSQRQAARRSDRT